MQSTFHCWLPVYIGAIDLSFASMSSLSYPSSKARKMVSSPAMVPMMSDMCAELHCLGGGWDRKV